MKKKTEVMDAFKHQDYGTLVENVDTLEASGEHWWTKTWFVIGFTVVLAAMDFGVLYSVLDMAVTQSQILGILLSVGIAFLLNFIPLLAAKSFFQTIYRIKRGAPMVLAISILIFLVLYSITVVLRFAYRNMYGGSDGGQLINTMESVAVNTTDVDDQKSIATVLLLSVEPLATSIAAFILGFFSSDEVKKRRHKLKRMITQLDESIDELEAAVECQVISEVEEVDSDERLMQSAVQDIKARSNVLRSQARLFLARYLQNPSSITVLSHELDDDMKRMLDEALALAALPPDRGVSGEKPEMIESIQEEAASVHTEGTLNDPEQLFKDSNKPHFHYA